MNDKYNSIRGEVYVGGTHLSKKYKTKTSKKA